MTMETMRQEIERVRAELAKQRRPFNSTMLMHDEDLIVRREITRTVADCVAERKFPVDKYADIDYESYYPDMYEKQ